MLLKDLILNNNEKKIESNLVAIVGFFDGSAGQIETWFEKETGYKIACFVSDSDSDSFKEVCIDDENKKRVCQTTEFPQNNFFKGRPLIVSNNWLNEIEKLGINKALCLDPINQKRKNHINLIREKGFQLISAIHPSALILPEAKISDGVWVNARAVIGYKAELASGVIINTGSQIDHHNIIEECSQVDPGVITSGNVVLRECCHVHTGTTIINRVKIGNNAIIGAGSVVLEDIPSDSTAYGVPAKVLSK